MLLPLQETVYEDQEADYRFGGDLHRVMWTKPPATHCGKETSASGGFLETEDPPSSISIMGTEDNIVANYKFGGSHGP